jgi:hypothetical protein
MQLFRLTLIAATLAVQVASSPVPVAVDAYIGAGALAARDAMPAAAALPTLAKRSAAAVAEAQPSVSGPDDHDGDDNGDDDDSGAGEAALKLRPRKLIPPGFGTCRFWWCR